MKVKYMDIPLRFSMSINDLAFVDAPKKAFLERINTKIPRKPFTVLVGLHDYYR